MKKTWVWLGLSVLIAGAGVSLLRPRAEPPRTWTEEVRVERGDVPLYLHELGVLAPRDPVMVKSPFNARLQWIIEDGTWVDVGEDVFILSDEDEVRRVADLRSQIIQARAELRLAEMRREHADMAERPKVSAAERGFTLAEIKRRLVDTKPVGGLELVKIADQLRPLAAASAQARQSAEQLQDLYQASLDAYLIALDARQGNKDAILRIQAKIDELETADTGEVGPDAVRAKEERQRQITSLHSDMDQARIKADKLEKAFVSAKAKREAAQAPRDAAARALAACEAAEADLRFRAEVEKKGLGLARLQLDERQQRIELDETKRKLEQTRIEVKTGSMSRVELERLEDLYKRQSNDLEVLRARLAIEVRPPDEAITAEADAQLEQARIAAEDARNSYKRTIDLLEQDLQLRRANVERLQADIDMRAAGFPAVLESGIRFAEREIALLGPDEAAERVDAEQRLQRMRAQFEAAKGSPPNIGKASVAGLARVMRGGDRLRQAGDQAWDQDSLVEIYPPANMDVSLRVNQEDIARLHIGMHAQVVIPSLHDKVMAADVVQVAGVGRDKYERPDYGGKIGFADVVDFDVRLHLLDTKGVDLRQGMAVRADIEIERRQKVLRLPLAAVRKSGDSWQVTLRDGSAVRTASIHGRPVGPEWFMIDDGIAEGSVVLIERTRNR